MTAPHPIQRRLWAEELVRLRRARERERYAASQRRGRIDPNPHQIDAVIFALERIPSGGCVLADEVGLGKTIEAGLVIAQLMAEGTHRVLVIVPKPLMGQWQHELYTLFGLEARDGMAGALAGGGVFIVGREFAGTTRGASAIAEAEPFGLCVIDEAHEIFAGIHRRYDRDGQYRDDSEDAMIAHRVKSALGGTPKILLTATPIQNSLTELWGLVQYVEPTGTLLGDLPTFRAVFCDGDDRTLAAGQEHELRRRVDQICKRTLRRQAQEFLERPFVHRSALLVEYSMSPEERSLYEDVTRYLLEPNLCAFRGRQRQLLLIGFHRRMASSLPALAASLRKVAERLERILAGKEPGAEAAEAFTADLEDDELAGSTAGEEDVPLDPGAVAAELSRVNSFIARARSITSDTKATKLLEAITMLRARGERGEGSGRVVVFTESLTTQDYLRAELLEAGIDDRDITLFRGNNDSPRAREALEIWRAEVEKDLPAYTRPTPDVAVRLALVHEFKTRSHIFLSTEAGAKGLNLQFCDTLINYDLPWNPQRIEQRIGRCHRYGQRRDVVVVNFSSTDNEAQRLLLDILMTKLDLFGRVLDASDVILHEPTTDTPELVGDARARLPESARPHLRTVAHDRRDRGGAAQAPGGRGRAAYRVRGRDRPHTARDRVAAR
ncbi:MAG TPA: SNF2-related protein [Kofleriaceae bacterium]|nr:SNF2-related protein [Kofleriaceae bacterium]